MPVSEKPIIFKGPMVRAILSGAKTQTRRVVKIKKQKHDGNNGYMFTNQFGEVVRQQCSYGIIGDRLWVRETFYCDDYRYPNGPNHELKHLMEYRASHDCRDWEAGCPCCDENMRGNWKPSIHMPRWASRINLEITNVRVEQIQDINASGVQAEGICEWPFAFYDSGDGIKSKSKDLNQFRVLWNSINEKRGFGWDKNPWVWAIDFKHIKEPT